MRPFYTLIYYLDYMRFIIPFAAVVLCCCCTGKHTGQKKILNYSEFLSMLSWKSKFEDSAYGDKLSDTFRKWFPVWDTVLANDGKYRAGPYLDSLAQQNKLDSINQVIVTGFLDKYGYPGRYQASTTGLYAIFIVIQHGSIENKEKYYPIFVQAYKDGNFPGISLALLEDRINMWRNRKQYYGTQHMKYDNGNDYLYPVVNPDSLNAWRDKMCGYSNNDTLVSKFCYTMEREYKELYNSKWDIDKYKKELPDLIKKFKVTDSTPIRFVK